MAGGINIEFVANVSKFIGGTKDVEGALDKVSDSLDDVARDAQRSAGTASGALEGTGRTAESTARTIEDASRTAADESARSYTSAADTIQAQARGTADVLDTAADQSARSADTAADTMERSFRDALDTVRAESRTSFDSVGDSAHQAGREGVNASEEFRSEAQSNFAEVASSFSGGMDSAADLVQGTLGGLAGSLPGPLGIVSGLLAGVGGAWLADWQKRTDEAKQLVSDMFDDMTASGKQFLTEEFVDQKIADIIKDQGKFDQAKRLATETGLSLAEALRALAGDSDRAKAASDRLSAAHAAENEKAVELGEQYRQTGNANATAVKQISEHQRELGELQSAIDGTSEAQEKARAQAAAYEFATKAVGDAASDTTGRLDAVGDAIKGIKSKTVTIDAKTADAQDDVDDFIEDNTGRKIYVSVETSSRLDAIGEAQAKAAGHRAGGGPVSAGQPYVVGENEPELFVPGQSGTILNQQQIGAALSRPKADKPGTKAGDTYNVSVTVDASSMRTMADLETWIGSVRRLAQQKAGVR